MPASPRQTDYAPGVAHEYRRARAIVMHIQFLNSHHSGLERGDYVGHAGVDFDQPIGERPAAPPHHARLADSRWGTAGQASSGTLQHAVAGDIQPGIDAENAEGNGILLH